MGDPTEGIRRQLMAEINAEPGGRAALEAEYGKVWNTDELCAEFDVVGFLAPLVVAIKRATGEKGTLFFQHHPRFYFKWQPDAGAK